MSERTRVRCTYTGCTTTFTRRADRVRHEKEKHGDFEQCKVEGCSWQNAKRKGRLDEHMKKAHNTGNKIKIPIDVPTSNPNEWAQQQYQQQPMQSYGYDQMQGDNVQYAGTSVATSAYDPQYTQATTSYTQQQPYYTQQPAQQPTYTAADSTQMDGYGYAGAQADNYEGGSVDAGGQYYPS